MTWKAFLLRTEAKGTDQEKFVTYTESWRRPAATEPGAVFNVWATDEPQPSSSVPAHVAGMVARPRARLQCDVPVWGNARRPMPRAW